MSLSYTTGNPNNLTGGTTAAMNDIQGPFTDIKTFLTDGSGAVGDTILASPTNAVWRTVYSAFGTVPAATVTSGNNYFFNTSSALPQLSGSGVGSLTGFWMPAAAGDVAVAGKTARLRLRACVAVNATTPATNYVWGLYPISGSLTGGASTITPTLGAAVGTVTSAGPAGGAAQMTAGTSFDYSTTAAQAFLLGLSVSATPTAASMVAFQLFLEMRHT